MTAHHSQATGKVVRVLDGTGQSPAMIDYLGQRLTAQLRHISTKLTAKMESRAATINDVRELASDAYVVAILGKGGAGQALALCDAQAIQASQHSKQELRVALNMAFSGGIGTAGVTWKRVSIVPIVQLAPFSDESSQASNRTFLSNLLIHEVGHLMSQHLPQKDHAMGGVMRSTLTSSDPEPGYSAAFVKSVGARFR